MLFFPELLITSAPYNNLFTPPIPNVKKLARPNRKALADDKLNVFQKVEYVFDRQENIVGKVFKGQLNPGLFTKY